MNETAVFDLYDILVNQMSGSSSVFIFLSLAVVVMMCAMFRLSNQATMLILVLYALIISATFGSLLPVVLVLVGFFFALALGKLIGAR